MLGTNNEVWKRDFFQKKSVYMRCDTVCYMLSFLGGCITPIVRERKEKVLS